MINNAIADAFNRIADLLEIGGESAFRINSYRRVARFLKSYTADITVVAAEKRLTQLPGIGKGTAEKIEQFIATERMDLLEELKSRFPSGLPDLLGIQGLGPKKIAVMHDRLGVAGFDDLRQAIVSGKLAELPGFGVQSVKRISEGMIFLERSGGRTPLGIALPIAEAMASKVARMPGVKQVAIAGSLRRGAETIGDVDLLCQSDHGERVVEQFVGQPAVKRVLAGGATKGSITVELERGRELQVDLRVVPKESFGAALQYFTGSKEHNVRLRERAIKKKWRLNEYGLFDGEEQIAGRTEASIYKKLGLPHIQPEIREDAGEMGETESPALVTEADLRGDLHLHTVASDGRCTIEEMAEAAKARGYTYIAVTDHSKSSTIANGLSVDRMIRHIQDVRAANARVKGIAILVGCECDILPDGSLDYPDEVLNACEVVVASVHSAMRGGKVPPTKRTVAAMENPYVTIIGHPSGRLLNRRPAMELDMDEIVGAAAGTGTALEINASWQRLDLKAAHVRQAVQAGVMLAIGTDSHHRDSLADMRYGVMTARRGWATASDILNTATLQSLRAWLARKRNQ